MDEGTWNIVKLGVGQFGLVFMGMATKTVTDLTTTQWRLLVLMFVLSLFIQITLLFPHGRKP